MAYSLFEGFDITRRSSGDTSASQYHCMILSTANDDDGCVLTTDENQAALGIWQNNSTAAEDGKLRVMGVSKAVVGVPGSAAIVQGTRLAASTTTGHLEIFDLSNGQVSIAYSLGALSTGSM